MTLVLSGVAVSLGGRRVLSAANVTLARGEVLGVIGPNGAGKSTLLRVAAGLLAPDAGRITLDGTPIHSWDRRQLGRRLAFLPQDRTVHWSLSVRALVGLGRLPHRGFAAAESSIDAAAIERAMAEADVAQLADRAVTELSGGERARVLLARALAQDAETLIADEPVAGLDPAHQLDVFECFSAMATKGRCIVVALHDLAAAARHCHRLLLLSGGRQLALAPPHDVLTPRLFAEGYGIKAYLSQVDGVPIVIPLARLT